MKQEQVRELQPKVFSYFQTVMTQGRLAHAYLFSGDFASYEMAIFLSQSLFCQEKEDALACGQCRTCRLIEEGQFSDVTTLAPQGNLIKTEMVRDLVKDFSRSGFESNQQVFIIREAEKMHANAANSLLKVMEEPQSKIHLFLLTNQEEAVLPTIKSRAQIVTFPKNQPLIERKLEEAGLLRNQAVLTAQLVSQLDQALDLAKSKSYLDLLAICRKFVDSLLHSQDRAYLLVPQLVNLAVEKAEQARLFELLICLLADQMAEKKARQLLTACLSVKKMWQANVSLQNSLEYLVLQNQN